MTPVAASVAASLSLAPASDEDFEALLALRMAAMREILPRLGPVAPQRARERLSRAFEPQHTRHILCDGERVGFVVLLPRPTLVPDHLVLDHLYIAPPLQGQGIGGWVMAQVMAEADRLGLALRLTAPRLADTDRFYRRLGFELQHESAWERHYLRPAADDREETARG